MSCRCCGNFFNRSFNLNRHETEYCPLRHHNSSTDSSQILHHSVNTNGKRIIRATMKLHQKVILTILTYLTIKKNTKRNPWVPLKAEASRRNIAEFNELTQNFTTDGLDEVEPENKAYLVVMPKLRKELQNVYLERLLWIRQLKRDPIHKTIMETRDAFINNDNFGQEEALEVAIEKTRFLMKRLFNDIRSPDAHEDTSMAMILDKKKNC